MIRQNGHIQGLCIDNTTHLLSQYADDTQIYLDGTKSSLEETVVTLKTFRFISGLKVNVDKTQAIWLGAASGSPLRLGHEDLDWVDRSFKVLGIVFSSNFKNMWKLNFPSKLEELKRLLSTWKRRKLTLYGRNLCHQITSYVKVSTSIYITA